MSICANDLLIQFGRKHYTYINAFLGDQTVRDIIIHDVKKNANTRFQLYVEGTNTHFEGNTHHVLKDSENIIHCSMTPTDNVKHIYYGFQDLNVNKHDTLCQSYSLLLYYGKLQKFKPDPSNPESHRKVQMEMIKLYRNIIKNVQFKKKICSEGILSENNRKQWINIEETVNSTKPISGNINTLIKKLHETLDEWEEYGYLWFTGNGTYSNNIIIRKSHLKKKWRQIIKRRKQSNYLD